MGMANKVLGVLIFIIGLALAIKTYYWTGVMSGVINDSLIKVIFWAGYVSIVVGIVFIKPIQLILTDTDVDILGMFRGLGLFIAGYFIAILSNYIIVVFADFSFFSQFSDIIWFAQVLLVVLMMLVIPNYFIYYSEIKERGL